MARIRQLIKTEDGKTVTGWTPRKGKAEGKRPPNRATWEITISLGRDRRGVLHQASERLVGTYSLAVERGKEMEVEAGRNPTERGHLLSDAMTAYIDNRVALGRAPKTIEGYRTIERKIRPRLGSVPLAKLDVEKLNGYLQDLGEEGLEARTLHHHRAFLKQVLTYAKRQKWVRYNAADDTESPTVIDPEPNSPTPDLIRILVTALIENHPQVAGLLILAALTGCRRGEVCGWKWSDFSVEGTQLAVRAALSRGADGELVERAPKTKRRRRMAIDPHGAQVLAWLWHLYEEECRGAEIHPRRSSWVFSLLTDHSDPMRPDSVTQLFRRTRDREVGNLRKAAAKVPPGAGRDELERTAEALATIKLADLRHYAATNLLAEGVDIRTASSRMGHDPVVMGRFYAAVVDAKDQAAAELLGRTLAEAMPPALLPAEVS